MDVLLRPRNRSAQLCTLGRAGLVVVAALLCSVNLAGQTAAPDLRQIMERLEGVERSNRELTEEVRSLRGQLAATNPLPTASGAEPEEHAAATSARPAGEGPELEEQVAVQGSRIEEQAQTKVESGQRFPIRIKGMLLFNTFLNSKQDGVDQYPTVAAPRGEYSYGGASLRQSVLGFEYRGPEVLGGGKLHASLLMDFFGGSGQALDEALRIRTATMQIDWKNRSVSMGIDKPIFAPREPSSLAQVGVSPLTGAGNLWMWIPQVKVEQTFHWSDTSTVQAQLGVVQTREIPYPATDNLDDVEVARPGLEGRVELAHNFGAGRRFELAPGFHVSTSHVVHASVPSRLFSMDWLAIPWRKLEFTGALFTGENVTHLGTGGVGQGFEVLGPQQVRPVHSQGGWAQWTVPATDRLSFHFFAGVQDDRNADLIAGQIGRNLAYGANLFYRLAPNVIVSLETSQVRTSYIQTGHRLNNHYDLAFAYLF
jgi:hypothetical protein